MVEAQAMGRPIIASDHGASREIVRHGNTGWLFPPGDVRKLSENIDHAIHLSVEHRHRIAEEAMANARENFAVNRMCNATLDVYRELLNEPVANASTATKPAGA
tara:strand:- start:394 stop:705 length:312 start_codon:yes stop_codon:yes gene_type:complete